MPAGPRPSGAPPGDVTRIDQLREFGLSPYAARAYAALLDMGAAEASDVARLARVPPAKVHHTLDALNARGLVTVAPVSPRRYAPVPFPEYLERLRNEYRERIHDLDAREAHLSQLFLIRGHATIESGGGDLAIVRGRRTFVDKVRQRNASARDRIDAITSHGFLHRVQGSNLVEAAARGVRVRLLARASDAEAPSLFSLLPGVDVRVERPGAHADTNVTTILHDGERALVNHFVPDDGSISTGDDVGLNVTEPGLVAALAAAFEARWALARPLRSTASSESA